MLVVLMYHRVSHTHMELDNEKALKAFSNHLQHLSEHYSMVVPGSPLLKHRINVCLTFDDCYFDFYHHVFPLLRKLQIPALLAIPSGLILEKATKSCDTRLQVPYYEALKAYKTQETLCSWDEINQMVASGWVTPASHGLMHEAITLDNLEQEVVYAKELLANKTNTEIKTFVYPYGRMERQVHRLVQQHHPYSMRIGSSWNVGWNNCHRVIYRINADEFWTQGRPLLSPWHQLNLWLRFLSNSVRFK